MALFTICNGNDRIYEVSFKVMSKLLKEEMKGMGKL